MASPGPPVPSSSQIQEEELGEGGGFETQRSQTERDATCVAEELADARLLTRGETLQVIEALTLHFLEAVSKGEDPKLLLVSRSERNIVRDAHGSLHLGQAKTLKRLFGKNGCGLGAERFAKIWQILALVQGLLLEGRVVTQREAYYTLVNQFKNQSEFNDTLQDVVALTGCSRSSLGVCASCSGGIAGLVSWKDDGGEPVNCSLVAGGKRIPGMIEGVEFESLGARYILVVEKDAVFTYLCGQRLWDTLPCILVTGCGYPPLSVRAVVRQLSTQLGLPVLGLFDYNPHGLRIHLTYKYGSTRMGTEAHAYAVDIKWLGVHHDDVFGSEGGRSTGHDGPTIPGDNADATIFQPWNTADEKAHTANLRTVQEAMSSASSSSEPLALALYRREVRLMGEKRLKAEIEALGNSGHDTLENKIVRKVLQKSFF